MKLCIESLERRALLAGELDTSFDTDGVAASNFDAFSERFSQVATAPGGKVVAAGFVGGSYLVARYTATGQLDTSFNGTGFVKTAITNFEAGGLAVSPTGKIYVGGSQYVSSGVSNAAIFAFTSDGQVDSGFDTDGVWTGAWTGRPSNEIVGMAFLSDRLYVGGGDTQNFAIARFTVNGALDSGFGVGGKAIYSQNGASAVVEDFLLAGASGSPQLLIGGKVGGSVIVLRYSTNGTRDTGFTSASLPSTLILNDLDVDSSGRVYLGGVTSHRASITRLTSAGALDTSFAFGGTYLSPIISHTSATSLAVSADGVLFTAPNGSAYPTTTTAAVALTFGGAPNNTFGTGGTLALPISNIGDALAQFDGKILIAGMQTIGGDQVDTKVIRLNAIPQPTEISGYLFDDINGDGLQNDPGGRPTFYGISVLLDLDNDGTADTGEPGAYAGNGKFVFSNVLPRTYTVIISDTGAAKQTFPRDKAGIPVTTSGPFNSVGAFGVQFASHYDVSGLIFNDLDGDGQHETGEAGISGTVYHDANGNGVWDPNELRATSSLYGQFTIRLPAGNQTLRQVVPEGYHLTGQSLTVPVVGSTFATNNVLRVPTDTANQVRFGQSVNAIAHIRTFNDLDSDGVRDAGEPALGVGGFVYDDMNNNGKFDAGDVRETAGPSGYNVIQLPPGQHMLRHSFDAGWTGSIVGVPLTITKTTASFDIDFMRRRVPANGATVSGMVYDDFNGSGTRHPDATGVIGITVYLDLDNDNVLDNNEARFVTSSNGLFTFTDVPNTGSGTHLRVSDPTPIWTVTQPTGGAGYTLNLNAGAVNTGLDFGFYRRPPSATAKLSGFLFNDLNTNGKFDGNDTKTSSGKQVFLDLDGDSQLDTGERVTTTDGSGNWNFANLPAGTYYVRRIFPSGYVGTTAPINVTLSAGQTISNLSIGSKPGTVTPPPPPPPTSGKLSGFLFNDLNGNGKFDGNDTRNSSGKQVFLDLDGDNQLDAGERVTTTNANGEWSIGELAAGAYQVRRVFPSGYVGTTAPINVTLAAGQTISNLSIGSKPGTVTPPPPPPPSNTATIKGRAFSDTNGNGKVDGGEIYTPDKPVFLDTDGDGTRDANETLVSTDKDGYFTFTNLAPGTYKIRRAFQPGYTYSTPILNITVTAGQTVTGLLVGTKKL